MADTNQDKQQRRVKVVDAQTHRTGEKRAAIKPHKRVTEPDLKQVINTYMDGLRAGSVSQTMWGATVDKNAQALRSIYGLAADDEPYLLLDITAMRTGRAGMLLAKSGVHLADGRGGSLAISWKDLASMPVGYQRGMLTIGQSGITARDGQALAGLLQQIQTKVAK